MIKNDIHKKDQAPAFNDKYTTEKEFIDFIFETIMTKDSSGAGGYSFNTRELFVNTVQPHISYAVSIFMQDTSIKDISRLINQHYPEVVYAALLQL